MLFGLLNVRIPFFCDKTLDQSPPILKYEETTLSRKVDNGLPSRAESDSRRGESQQHRIKEKIKLAFRSLIFRYLQDPMAGESASSKEFRTSRTNIQRDSKRMTRSKIIISNN